MPLPKTQPRDSKGRFLPIPGGVTDMKNNFNNLSDDINLLTRYSIDQKRISTDILNVMKEVHGVLLSIKDTMIGSREDTRLRNERLDRMNKEDAIERVANQRTPQNNLERPDKVNDNDIKEVNSILRFLVVPVKDLLKGLKNIVTGIASLGPLLLKVGVILAGVVSVITGAIKGLENNGDFLSVVREAIANLIKTVYDTLTFIVKTIAGVFFGDKIARKIEDIGNATLKTVLKNWRDFADAIAVGIKAIFDGRAADLIVDMFKGVFHEIAESLKVGISAIYVGIRKSIAGMLRSVSDTIGNIPGSKKVIAAIENKAKTIEDVKQYEAVPYQMSLNGENAKRTLEEDFNNRKSVGGRVGDTISEPAQSDKKESTTERVRGPGMNKDEVIKYLMSKGMTNEQATGVTANLIKESGLNPNSFTTSGGGKGAFGIAQWRGERQTKLMEFAKSRNTDIGDIKTQLDFIIEELNTSHRPAGEALSRAKTPEEAAKAFSNKFEIPALNKIDLEIEAEKRAKLSSKIYNPQLYQPQAVEQKPDNANKLSMSSYELEAKRNKQQPVVITAPTNSTNINNTNVSNTLVPTNVRNQDPTFMDLIGATL